MKDGISGSDKESRRFLEYGLYKAKNKKFCEKKSKKMKNSVDIYGTNMV